MSEEQRIETLGVISEAIQKKVKEARAEGYLTGYKAAIHRYAYWKAGTQYVGTTGKTLSEALVDAEKELRR